MSTACGVAIRLKDGRPDTCIRRRVAGTEFCWQHQPTEAMGRVERYLRQTAGAILEDLCRDLGLTSKDARSALRRIGAERRAFCDAWQRVPTVVFRSKDRPTLGRRTAMRRVSTFNLWRMPRSA